MQLATIATRAQIGIAAPAVRVEIHLSTGLAARINAAGTGFGARLNGNTLVIDGGMHL